MPDETHPNRNPGSWFMRLTKTLMKIRNPFAYLADPARLMETGDDKDLAEYLRRAEISNEIIRKGQKVAWWAGGTLVALGFVTGTFIGGFFLAMIVMTVIIIVSGFRAYLVDRNG